MRRQNGLAMFAPRFGRWPVEPVLCALFVALMAGQPLSALRGQTGSYYGCCAPPIQLRQDAPTPSRVRITYGGRVYLSFPNYDVLVSPAPGDLEELIQGDSSRIPPTVISKNDEGMRWDGGGFFLHPAYPLEDVTRYHYRNRIVGQLEKQWPEPVSREPADARDRISPAPSVPTVAGMQPELPPYIAPYEGTPTQFLPAPWVVAPPVEPEPEPTPTERGLESPYEGIATQFLPAPWAVAGSVKPLSESARAEMATESRNEGIATQFLPAPWVVAPPVKPLPESTPAEKTPELPYSSSFQQEADTKTGVNGPQPPDVTDMALGARLSGERETVRRVLTNPTDCWTPQGWSSPECIEYRKGKRR